MTRSRVPFGVLFAVLFASPLLRADVLVVDVRGGGDFTTLTAAVAAAVDGDTILVRDGEYFEAGPVDIDGKALTIAAEWFDPDLQSSGVTIRSGLIVRHLPPGQFVVLENLIVFGSNSSSLADATPGLALRDNNSHVRVQGCMLVGGTGNHNSHPDGAPGVEVVNSFSAGLTGCYLYGGDGQFSPSLAVVTGDGGPGLYLDVGQVHLSHSVANGGYGGSNQVGGWPDGGVGGAGIRHIAGTLPIVSCSMSGGAGGTSHFGGDGGIGLQMGSSGFAWLLAGSFAHGGDGGSSDVGPQGAHGAAMVDASGLITDYGGTPHGFDVTSPLREGQSGVLSLEGDPSDAALLFASLSMHQLGFPGKQGVFMLFPTALIGPIGLPGLGDLPFTAPLLPASIEALNVHLQPVYVGGDGVVIGAGRVLTLLDAGF